MKMIPLASIAVAMTLSSAATQAATLIHSYDFNQNTHDSVGVASGQLMGGAIIQDGELVLDSKGSFLQFDSAIIPTQGSYAFSFDVTRTMDQIGPYVEFISQGNGAAGLFFGAMSNGQLRVGTAPTPFGPQANNTGAFLGEPGTRIQYTLSYDHDAKATSLFIDGKLFETYALSVGLNAIDGNTRLGAQYESYGEYFGGRIDNFKVFEGALTAKEASLLAAPVPEPSAYLMALIGIATVALGRKAARKA